METGVAKIKELTVSGGGGCGERCDKDKGIDGEWGRRLWRALWQI